MVNAAERPIMAQQTVKRGAYFKGHLPAEKPDKRFTKRDFRSNIVSTLCAPRKSLFGIALANAPFCVLPTTFNGSSDVIFHSLCKCVWSISRGCPGGWLRRKTERAFSEQIACRNKEKLCVQVKVWWG